MRSRGLAFGHEFLNRLEASSITEFLPRDVIRSGLSSGGAIVSPKASGTGVRLYHIRSTESGLRHAVTLDSEE